jgi:hypothetical protein
MIRAIETAQLINKELSEFNLPIRSDALLSEGNLIKKLFFKISYK